METAHHSISADQALRKGEAIFSLNGQFKAVFEQNGDFNLYQWQKLWSTNTAALSGDCISLNKNTTLAIYRDGSEVWKSGNPQPDSAKVRLNVTDDGHVTITDLGKEMWKAP
ncbi:B-type lectin plumieribetin-like [Synchiropus picturatus]